MGLKEVTLYRRAIQWIAHNDDPDAGFEDTMNSISVAFVSDMFAKTTNEVASDVMRRRKQGEN